MRVERLPTARAAVDRAAQVIAELLGRAVATRGRASLALSGGRTSAALVSALNVSDAPWNAVDLFQVDERLVPADHRDRNWRALVDLADRVSLGHAHPMPVELGAGADVYAAELVAAAGSPPVLDVVQLGMGADGHTASLPPGDPVVEVDDRDVALSGEYAGHQRMTLTVPALRRARAVVWVVVGADKADAVRRMVNGDPSSVAGRVAGASSLLVVDEAAAQLLSGPAPGSNG
jgi:6-phosphogluconolactonase